MTLRSFPRPPRRRSCAGCLVHHPCTLGLTLVALLFWLPQILRTGIALAAARPPDLGSLVLTTLLLLLAQADPRLAPALWRCWTLRLRRSAARTRERMHEDSSHRHRGDGPSGDDHRFRPAHGSSG